jgi:YbbR domain-containing protein
MGDFFRHFVLHNIGLKLLSLLLAVVLWFGVVREPVAEVAVDVPIEFHNIPPNLEISSEVVPRAQIRVRGPQQIIRHLQSADIYADIDLNGVKPGDRTYDLTSDEVHKPTQVEVVQVIPSQFHIAFDIRETREVPIQPRIVGKFADGYRISRIKVDPPMLKVVGPRKQIDQVDAAITDPIDVSGAINQISFVRHAYVSDPLVQAANPNPVRITVVMERIDLNHGDQATN